MIWKRVRLAEISEVITKGTTPTTLGFSFAQRGVPFLRVQNIHGGTVNFRRDALFIDDQTHAALKRSQIQPGDVLVSIAGTIGRAGIVPADAPALNCNQAVAIIRPNARVFRPFLRMWLETTDAQRQMIGSAVTGTIANLSLTQVGNLQMPIPPLTAQRRIAHVLERAEALRTKRRAALAELENLTRSIFIDLFGDPVANDKGWKRKAIGELGNVVTGGTPPSAKPGMFDGPIPFVTPGDLEGNDQVRRSVTVAGAQESRTVRAGATFVCCIGTIGKMGIAHVESAFNQQINAIEWSAEVDDIYGYTVLTFFKPTIKSWGASTTVPILKKSSFQRMEIPVPPLGLQRRYTQTFQSAERLRAGFRTSLDHIDELFDSLQYLAFRGEL